MKNLVLLSLLFIHAAWANPSGAHVIQGSITQNDLGDGKLVITSDSDLTLVHWDQFNIKEGEHTHFELPLESNAIINRDIGGLPSHIFGDLTCNGTLVFLNPLGINIGENGSIVANHLLASTLDIDDDAMFSRKPRMFKGSGGKLDNKGTILSTNGDVVLLSSSINHQGLINAQEGSVVIGASPELILYSEGVGRITIRPNVTYESSFTSSGDIFGENIEIATCSNPFACAINLSGTLSAHQGSDDIGSIHITTGGDIAFDGYVHGSLDVAANDILVTSSIVLDASHETAPGNIDMVSMSKIYISEEAMLTTNAHIKGNGGDINLIAELATVQAGICITNGGKEGGHGGNIELSGKHFVVWPGEIEREALHPDFSPGKLILDPESDITLSDREDINYNLFKGQFTPSMDNMNINIDALSRELNKGPVIISTTYPGPLPGKGSITMDENTHMLYTSPYDLTLRCYSDQDITLAGSIINQGLGSIACECEKGSVNLHGNLSSYGPITIGSPSHPVGKTILVEPRLGNTTLMSKGGEGITLCANEGVEIQSSQLGEVNITSTSGPISFISDQSIVIDGNESNTIQITTGEQGSITFKGINTDTSPAVSLQAHTGSISCQTDQGDIIFDKVGDIILNAEDKTVSLTTNVGNLRIAHSKGSLLLDSHNQNASINIGGGIEANIGSNLLMQSGLGDTLINAKGEQVWTINGNMLLYSEEGKALLEGKGPTKLSVMESLLLSSTPNLKAGIDTESLLLFVGGDLLMEGGSFIGQNTDVLSLSINGETQLGIESSVGSTCTITAGSVDLSSGKAISLHNNSSICALKRDLSITSHAPITLFDNTSLIADQGSVEVKSLTNHIALHDSSQVLSTRDSVSMIAKESIFLYDKTKITSHGPHGMNLVCDFGKSVGSGRFFLARDAKVNSSHAPLNIFASSQKGNRIDGTLNDVNYKATPTYFTNSEEAWGVNFIDHEAPTPLNVDPITEKFPLVKYLEIPNEGPYHVFYKDESLINVGTTALTNQAVLPIVTNFIGPFNQELARDLHDYDDYLWANTQFATVYSQELEATFDLAPSFYFCPKFTIHYLNQRSPYLRKSPKKNAKGLE